MWMIALCAASLLRADVPAPDWSHDAIWYQVFVERFRNGDASNDPTLESMAGAWPHEKPPEWAVTPWQHDWYQPDPWVRPEDGDFYRWVHHRRYGGDLQGLIDKLDEIQGMGVNALYLNPVNDAPSLHKYDARHWRHVDVHFGPDPEGDRRLIAAENPADPATWVWTSADLLFLELVDDLHRRGMRLILDYSWNHTGSTFWAFQDVLEKQAASPYADWYVIHAFDDPATEKNEFDYEGWAGIRELPAVTQTGIPEATRGGARDGDLHPGVRSHVLAVTQRWLDPDGDGDPSDGIDGYRLDVAEQVPLGFWRDYRAFVKGINPEALLVGEIWWEHWPHTMMDPRPWLEAFDSVMHYQWYSPVRAYLAGTTPWFTAEGLMTELDRVMADIPRDRQLALMNLVASHDSPRFTTSIANRGRYKYLVNPRENPACRLGPPDESDRRVMSMIRVQQMTWPGAPHIWNGDEFGMWGADDPDNRKPVAWPDLGFVREAWRPFGDGQSTGRLPTMRWEPDMSLRDELRELIKLRREHAELFSEGELRWLFRGAPASGTGPASISLHDLASSLRPDAPGVMGFPRILEEGLLACERRLGDTRAVVLFNTGQEAIAIQGEEEGLGARVFIRFEHQPGNWRRVVDTSLAWIHPPQAEEKASCLLQPESAQVWLLEP